ncbi:MAG TPA: chemotaxis protein CheW [Gemmatimonadaceae bacterium]|nr:chemotaxis protein CheW [Gemmatimonadaceae bacterium]
MSRVRKSPRDSARQPRHAPRAGARERKHTPLDVSAVTAAVAPPERRPRTVTDAAPDATPRVTASEATSPEHIAEPVDARSFATRVRERAGRAALLVFRVGQERFALELATVEEAVETPVLRTVPDAPAGMVGVFPLRGRLVPTFAPERSLGVNRGSEAPNVLVIRTGAGRFALAVDDVDDVFDANLSTARDAPGTDDPDGVLLAVIWRNRDLIGILDGDALRDACVVTPLAATA